MTSAERVSVVVDFTKRLAPSSDKILSVSLFTQAGSAIITEESHDELTVTAWVQGGTPGRYSDMTCRVQTQGDRILDEILSCYCYA